MRTIINNSLFCLLAMVAATLCGCSDSIFEDEAQNDGGSIRLAADIEQLAVMRVNDCGFCDGDMMGVYVVDYEGGNPGTLKLKGNRGDNVRYTFDEAANKWTGAYELYWKDGHTPVDVYGYYPFAAPESIEDYQFEVQKDQSKASSSDEMGGYEASDFLWGKVDEVAPTSSVIRLPLSHRMSNARVTLLQGTGFTAEEWAATEKIVLVQNVARKASINLANGTVSKAGEGEEGYDDQIPGSAFYYQHTNGGSQSLTRIILPDRLRAIGGNAFYGCNNLTGSLVIPEGVTEIRRGAFNGCSGLNGTLTLPSTLRKLGNNWNSDTADEGTDYYGGVFQNCSNLTGNLVLPNNLELIRGYCFAACSGLSGELRLPEKLKHMGRSAFSFCPGLTGSLTIPQGLSTIPVEAFSDSGFNGTLTLHDGITNISILAFNNCHFKGELRLPKNLRTISERAFTNNDFSGELKLPPSVEHIGSYAFTNNWRITGILSIPEGVVSIGQEAFAGCKMLEGVIFPESMETIRQRAFAECFGIGSIVCRGTIPPRIENNALDGVAKDNFTVEVPVSAVASYQTAQGWCEFKRIAAHHELTCRPSVACALSTEHKQTITVQAEGEMGGGQQAQLVRRLAHERQQKDRGHAHHQGHGERLRQRPQRQGGVSAEGQGLHPRMQRGAVWLPVWRERVADAAEGHARPPWRYQYRVARRWI